MMDSSVRKSWGDGSAVWAVLLWGDGLLCARDDGACRMGVPQAGRELGSYSRVLHKRGSLVLRKAMH